MTYVEAVKRKERYEANVKNDNQQQQQQQWSWYNWKMTNEYHGRADTI